MAYLIIFLPIYVYHDARFVWMLFPVLIALTFTVLFERIDSFPRGWTFNVVSTFLVIFIVWSALWHGRDRIVEWVSGSSYDNPTMVMAEWIRDNTQPHEVVMTSALGVVSWYADRPGVNIPCCDAEAFETIAGQFGVDWLVFDDNRTIFKELLARGEIENLVEVARFPPYTIYRVGVEG